jgi:hypothetical protein
MVLEDLPKLVDLSALSGTRVGAVWYFTAESVLHWLGVLPIGDNNEQRHFGDWYLGSSNTLRQAGI